MWPFRKWTYLGWSPLIYVTNKGLPSERESERVIVHFYGSGKDFKRRKAEIASPLPSVHKGHAFYQQRVVPWLRDGGHLTYFGAILNPSDSLSQHMAERHNIKWDRGENKWVCAISDPPSKPEPEAADVDDNVIRPTKFAKQYDFTEKET